ncbi:unnamed protein product [Rhizoctonia solani]|uniref:Minor extracellular protease vpr n=1 Tax=Rhizoctonia solani TaxID=456999 RepID=A0A8H3I0K6_9AGAM|nr:unnamed protein product [Rhizoctonia solani]
MRSFIGFAAVVQLVSAAVDIKSIKYEQTTHVVPNSYIVALSPNGHLKRGFTSPHHELYHDLQRRGTKWKVTRNYSSNVFTGAAVQIGSAADLFKLAKVSSVRSITPNYIYPAPKPVFRHIKSNKKRAIPEDGLSTHAMTGVDKLHAEGYTGKGIKIGIIDSGVDYNHPALGGGMGPGKKIIGGYDFVGDAYTGPNGPPPVPGHDPLDQCDGHGTHVAGIIGANPNNPHNIRGVAYQSKINAYRVFGCGESTSDDIIISALIRADEDGNDIITLSVNNVRGWTEGTSAVLASRIADKGKVVIVSAGNDGESGAWYASAMGSGRSVISIGSVDNTKFKYHTAVASNGWKINYVSYLPLPIPAGLRVYATSHDLTVANDACNPLPTDTPDLSILTVLIRVGGCSLITKIDNAAAYGARYFLVYDNQSDRHSITLVDVPKYTAAGISRQDGIFLLREAIPRRYTISFPNSPAFLPIPSAGLMSSTSRYGPSYDMYLKPALAAPGFFIASTIPVSRGSWGIQSGTSQAAPYVAGSVALLLQARGNSVNMKKVVRAIFQNTASPVKAHTNSPLLATAAHQGAGLINVYDAVKNTGSLLPAELLLNDTAHFRSRHTLKLHNGGRESVTYRLTHVPAGTALTMNGPNVNRGPVPLASNSATVTIHPTQVTVPPGRTRSVAVAFEPPIGLDATTFPVYSGYINAAGSDGTKLQSTYIGLAAKLKDAQVLDNTDAYFGHRLPVLVDRQRQIVPPRGSSTYTMNGDETPYIIYRLLQGTPLLRADLIDSRTGASTNPRHRSGVGGPVTRRFEAPTSPHSAWSKRSFLGCLFPGRSGPGTCGGILAGVETLGMIFHNEYVSRHTWDPEIGLEAAKYNNIKVESFTNGTAIPNGTYRILLRALKITGNPQKQEDYEFWTSPKIVIRRG